MILSLKKLSAVPTSSFDEPPDKQARRNPAALIYNILWIISKKQDTQCKFQSVLVKKVFKDCPKNQRNIKNIQIYVNDIRELRNRVCHYEKIIHFSDINQKYLNIQLCINWISKDLSNLTK